MLAAMILSDSFARFYCVKAAAKSWIDGNRGVARVKRTVELVDEGDTAGFRQGE